MGPPLSVFAAVLAVVGHHQGPDAMLSQAQTNALVTALGTFDWSNYTPPDTRFPPEDDDGC